MGQRCNPPSTPARKGETLPKTVGAGSYWYAKTNMSDPKIEPILYD